MNIYPAIPTGHTSSHHIVVADVRSFLSATQRRGA